VADISYEWVKHPFGGRLFSNSKVETDIVQWLTSKREDGWELVIACIHLKNWLFRKISDRDE